MMVEAMAAANAVLMCRKRRMQDMEQAAVTEKSRVSLPAYIDSLIGRG